MPMQKTRQNSPERSGVRAVGISSESFGRSWRGPGRRAVRHAVNDLPEAAPETVAWWRVLCLGSDRRWPIERAVNEVLRREPDDPRWTDRLAGDRTPDAEKAAFVVEFAAEARIERQAGDLWAETYSSARHADGSPPLTRDRLAALDAWPEVVETWIELYRAGEEADAAAVEAIRRALAHDRARCPMAGAELVAPFDVGLSTPACGVS